jgi:hypothetical protein
LVIDTQTMTIWLFEEIVSCGAFGIRPLALYVTEDMLAGEDLASHAGEFSCVVAFDSNELGRRFVFGKEDPTEES